MTNSASSEIDRAATRPSPLPQTALPRLINLAGIAAWILLSWLVFHAAQRIGGQSWDEIFHFKGMSDQIRVTAELLAGDLAAHFSDVCCYLAFYGVTTSLPAYLLASAASTVGLSDRFSAFVYTNHAIAFMLYLVTIAFAFRLLLAVTTKKSAAAIGSILLALYPLWLGFSFFNNKDVPTACFVLIALHAAVRLLQAPDGGRHMPRHATLLATATILLAGLKLPALMLIIPSWIAAVTALLQARQIPTVLLTCAVTGLGVIAITPMAWMDPVNFAIETTRLMANHGWNGCSLTAGNCIFVHSDQWSAWFYLYQWYSVQLPVAIAAGAIGGLCLAPFRGSVHVTIAAALVFPLLLIVLGNSPLYDGLRHVLFTIPLIFVLAALFWHEISKHVGPRPIVAGAMILGAFFAWDNYSMFPYNYVSFNLPARQGIDQTRYLTDLWGFSLREAANLSIAKATDVPLLGYPDHLISPYVSPPGRRVIPWQDAGGLPAHSEVIIIAYTRDTELPSDCSEVQYVSRQLPAGGRTLRLSYAARCKIN